ncbi:MAG TPA: response regulator transcription factor [Bacteroidetes bacterium]|nr:response regulator transcription factor [Bacteroidota bacterium]
MKIFIVDDHSLFREGLKLLLSKLEFVEEVFEAANGQELVENYDNFRPDIILLDIEMPVLNGIEAARIILKKNPEQKIIVLSMYSDEQYYVPMIELGVSGFLQKNIDFADVKAAIKEVLEGNNYFSPEILKGIVLNLNSKKDRKNCEVLTKREVEILLLICKGFSNSEIAEKLFISKRTVDKHRENLLLKTEAKNTAGLVVFAIKKEIFTV